ncbi:hypothetical protein CYLTODRAFT_422119 [Cylindrobasidium torrendii FP15055 ss-10]|uniref:Xylanolytic transcriptional activator regulatory domain-containing protein n=1 Tax=Cylindrobasidium torrendii FP15055 ss-10 TaxID=1314674 RepID=A0A0D7BBL1_9AGAR|nr:hypothetical protein CYLTODRAFT_422119 [Cylindrobasidium torrendii FP15055 ss-10]
MEGKTESTERPSKRARTSRNDGDHTIDSEYATKSSVSVLEKRMAALEDAFNDRFNPPPPPEDPSPFVTTQSPSPNQLLESFQPDIVSPLAYGPSCCIFLAQSAFRQKYSRTGEPLPKPIPPRTAVFPRREEFASEPPFLLAPFPSDAVYTFPEDALRDRLIDNYFLHYNHFLPLLHRPTFQQALEAQLYLKDEAFGGTVLLVCALGTHAEPKVEDERWLGLQWFNQVDVFRSTARFARPTLHEIQMHILAIMFAHAFGKGYSVDFRLSIAFRRIIEVGAHREEAGPSSSRKELWKRAFWVLLFMDVSDAGFRGRPTTLRYEDFDARLPIECDDQFWGEEGHPMAFVQPPSTPSTITAFNHLLKLTLQLLHIQSSMYSIRKPPGIANSVEASDADTVMHFDSDLNLWLEALPAHLSWQTPESAGHFSHSAFLHITYTYVRLTIHRPFIEDNDGSSASFPICVNAARSCLRVAEAIVSRKETIYIPHVMQCLQNAGLVSMRWAWRTVRSRQDVAKSQEFRLMGVLLDFLKNLEDKISMAGISWDALSELMSIPSSLPESVLQVHDFN